MDPFLSLRILPHPVWFRFFGRAVTVVTPAQMKVELPVPPPCGSEMASQVRNPGACVEGYQCGVSACSPPVASPLECCAVHGLNLVKGDSFPMRMIVAPSAESRPAFIASDLAVFSSAFS